MAEHLPSWFKADNVFDDQGQWFFGSEKGLYFGPYPERSIAEARSHSATERLLGAKSASEQVRIADSLMTEEQQFIKEAGVDSAQFLVDEVEVDLPRALVRSGELVSSWARSDRFFQLDGAWYFSTREGANIGPHHSLDAAKRNAQALIAKLIIAKDQGEAIQVIESHRTDTQMDPSNIRFAGVRQFRRVY